MKIAISSNEVEIAVTNYLKEEKNITVRPADIKWTESFTHPVYPLYVEVK